MSKIYAVNLSRSNACIKIINDAQFELSLAFDDSAGASKVMSRNYLNVYDKDGELIQERYGMTPEEILKKIADHLGYEVKLRK